MTRVLGCGAAVLLATSLAVSLPGCSLFVMAGKMLWGDPVIPSELRLQTGVNLGKEKKQLVIVCSTPESIKSETPSLQLDLTEAIHRELKKRGLRVVDSDDVASWIDESGGFWTDPSELAEQFDADYIAQIDVEQLSYHELNSPSMFRGRASGSVSVYEVSSRSSQKRTTQVFVKEFRVEYPRHHPISADQITERVFQQRFLDDLSGHLARYFYDYRRGDDF